MFANFTVIGAVAVLGVLSPGPDFFIVTKNSLTYSRRTGLYTALGIAIGTLIHMAYCLLGIGVVISESQFLFNCIKYLGAGYLIYIGIQSLQAKKAQQSIDPFNAKSDLTPYQAIKIGFLTNALNPKATLFFLSVFSQVVDYETSIFVQFLYAFEILLIAFLWFCLLAFILTNHNLKNKLIAVQHYIEKAMGIILLALGLKIAFI